MGRGDRKYSETGCRETKNKIILGFKTLSVIFWGKGGTGNIIGDGKVKNKIRFGSKNIAGFLREEGFKKYQEIWRADPEGKKQNPFWGLKNVVAESETLRNGGVQNQNPILRPRLVLRWEIHSEKVFRVSGLLGWRAAGKRVL